MDSPRSTQLLAIMEGYRKLRNLIEAAKVEIEAPRKESTGGEGTFRLLSAVRIYKTECQNAERIYM